MPSSYMDQDSISFSLEREPEALLLLISSRNSLGNPNYKFFKALCASSSAVANFIKKHYISGREHREKEPRQFPITFFRSDCLTRDRKDETPPGG